jgi:hypothetical protein
MLDFSGVKAITIPEGKVVRITSGDTLIWEQAERYTLLDYLQFNADMVFDTGVICTDSTTIEVKFTRESTDSKYLYGVRTTNNTASVTAYLATSGAWRFGNTYRNYTVSQNVDNTAIVKKSGITMNGTTTKYIATVKAFTSPYTLTIGSARTTSGAKSAAQFVGKIYYFKMWDGDSLILDLAPCSLASGEKGFVDLVTNKILLPI